MAGKPGQSSDLPVIPPDAFSETFLEDLDGRSAIARELKRRLSELEANLGGSEQLSYQQRSLAKRAVFIEYRLEAIELELARGTTVDIDVWTKLIAALVRLFDKLGLKRRAKEIDLKGYLGQRMNAQVPA